MLVLSRRVGEALVINDQIEIKVTEIVGDKVKIGISAPRDMLILRKELMQTVESNKEAANGAATKDLMEFLANLK